VANTIIFPAEESKMINAFCEAVRVMLQKCRGIQQFQQYNTALQWKQETPFQQVYAVLQSSTSLNYLQSDS
jgi:hypothetical protein